MKNFIEQTFYLCLYQSSRLHENVCHVLEYPELEELLDFHVFPECDTEPVPNLTRSLSPVMQCPMQGPDLIWSP